MNDIRERKCIERIPARRLPDNISADLLKRKWLTWGRFKERSKARESKCGPTAIIRAVFPDSTENAAISVATCESNLYIYAQNPSGASGLFQLMPFWWQGKFNPFDPWANTRAAHSISSGGTNWGAWVCQP